MALVAVLGRGFVVCHLRGRDVRKSRRRLCITHSQSECSSMGVFSPEKTSVIVPHSVPAQFDHAFSLSFSRKCCVVIIDG